MLGLNLSRKISLNRANQACLRFSSSSSSSSSSYLSHPPVLPSSLQLSNIRDNEGARKRTRRKGRGVGSGHGLARSAGEGSKGHKSHEGGTTSWGFEGGQAPLWRRTPKIGVAMPRFLRKELETLSLEKLQLWKFGVLKVAIKDISRGSSSKTTQGSTRPA